MKADEKNDRSGIIYPYLCHDVDVITIRVRVDPAMQTHTFCPVRNPVRIVFSADIAMECKEFGVHWPDLETCEGDCQSLAGMHLRRASVPAFGRLTMIPIMKFDP